MDFQKTFIRIVRNLYEFPLVNARFDQFNLLIFVIKMNKEIVILHF